MPATVKKGNYWRKPAFVTLCLLGVAIPALGEAQQATAPTTSASGYLKDSPYARRREALKASQPVIGPKVQAVVRQRITPSDTVRRFGYSSVEPAIVPPPAYASPQVIAPTAPVQVAEPAPIPMQPQPVTIYEEPVQVPQPVPVTTSPQPPVQVAEPLAPVPPAITYEEPVPLMTAEPAVPPFLPDNDVAQAGEKQGQEALPWEDAPASEQPESQIVKVSPSPAVQQPLDTPPSLPPVVEPAQPQVPENVPDTDIYVVEEIPAQEPLPWKDLPATTQPETVVMATEEIAPSPAFTEPPVAEITPPAPAAVENPIVAQALAEVLPTDAAVDSTTQEQLQPVLPEPPLSDASRATLHSIPPGIQEPKAQEPKEPISVVHAAVPNLELPEGDVKLHESQGIRIEVKQQNFNENLYLEQAFAAVQAGQFEVAKSMYRQILQAQPGSVPAMFGLASLLQRDGQKTEARQLYSQILEQEPHNRETLNNFLIMVSEESPSEALQELRRLEADNPNFDPIPAQIAAIQAQQGQIGSAIDSMVRAAQLAPDNVTYKHNLAILLDQAGRKPEAIAAYQQVIEAYKQGQPIPADVSAIQERLTYLLSNRS